MTVTQNNSFLSFALRIIFWVLETVSRPQPHIAAQCVTGCLVGGALSIGIVRLSCPWTIASSVFVTLATS